jgi:hypothetical protein
MFAHEAAVCKRTGPQHFHTKSWSDRFECSVCKRARRFNLNFLGGRRVVFCNGEKMYRSEHLSVEEFALLRLTVAIDKVVIANGEGAIRRPA